MFNFKGFPEKLRNKLIKTTLNLLFKFSHKSFHCMVCQELTSIKKKITVRVRVGPFIKTLSNGIVIKDKKDARLKIRQNLSIKCMEDEEAQKIIDSNKNVTSKLTIQ